MSENEFLQALRESVRQQLSTGFCVDVNSHGVGKKHFLMIKNQIHKIKIKDVFVGFVYVDIDDNECGMMMSFSSVSHPFHATQRVDGGGGDPVSFVVNCVEECLRKQVC